MGDSLEGTAEQTLQRLMSLVGAKARVSLERIKAACDKIEAMRGLMNYSRVAAMTVELFGSPRAQTIQNNPHLKAYIATRIAEYQKAGVRSVGSRLRNGKGATMTHYPASGLDSKTRLHIDFLRQDNERLQTENKRLSRLLERESQRQPLSLAGALRDGPTENLGLDIRMSSKQRSIPLDLLVALEVIFFKKPPFIQIQRRGNSVRLSCETEGIVQAILTPAQWNDAIEWLHIQREKQ